MHPAMVQDQVATTDKMGTCTLDLLPGVYDLFVSASGLSPYAVKVDVVAGRRTLNHYSESGIDAPASRELDGD